MPLEKAYLVPEINYNTGGPFYNEQTHKMESILLRAFRHVDGKRIYSRLSWPAIGLTPNPLAGLTFEYKDSQVYQEFFAVAESQGGQGGGGCGELQSIQVAGPATKLKPSNTVGYYYTATGYYENNCTEAITDTCVWESADTAHGFFVSPGHLVTNPSGNGLDNNFGIKCKVANIVSNSLALAMYSEVKSKCIGDNLENENAQGDDKGYWVENERSCWVIAAAINSEQNCNYACNSQLAATCENFTPPSPNWDDDNKNICLTLVNAPNPPLSPLPISPNPVQATDLNFGFAPTFSYVQGSNPKAN